VFLGEYEVKFTGFGRVVLPKKIREEVNGRSIILSRGIDGCIWGFSVEGFEIEARKQLEVPATEERARFLRRYLFSASADVELDSQGRFVIPSNLLEYAKIKDEVVVIGAGDHFEIWNKESWEAHLKTFEEDYNGGVS
jgi:MraZ protein